MLVEELAGCVFSHCESKDAARYTLLEGGKDEDWGERGPENGADGGFRRSAGRHREYVGGYEMGGRRVAVGTPMILALLTCRQRSRAACFLQARDAFSSTNASRLCFLVMHRARAKQQGWHFHIQGLGPDPPRALGEAPRGCLIAGSRCCELTFIILYSSRKDRRARARHSQATRPIRKVHATDRANPATPDPRSARGLKARFTAPAKLRCATHSPVTAMLSR